MNSRINRSFRLLISEIHLSRLLEIYRAFFLFHNPVTNILIYLGLISLKGPKTVIMKNGCKIRIKSVHDLISIWGCWIRHDYPVSGHEKIIIDAGANIGTFSTFAISKSSPNTQIYALEPVKETFENLKKNIEDNKYDEKIKTLNYGVASTSGEQVIYVNNAGTYSSSYVKFGKHTETVNVKNLKDILKYIGDPESVDLLKMDCEGAEMDTLLGADIHTLRHFERIVFEYHDFSGFTIDEISDHLLKAGFKKIKIEYHPLYSIGFADFVKSDES